MKEEMQFELQLESGSYLTYKTSKYENRKPYSERRANEIVSYIPGTIVKLCINEGETVKQGEPLLILEAMKMENIVRMPQDGKVKRILVSENQRIGKNTTMIILE